MVCYIEESYQDEYIDCVEMLKEELLRDDKKETMQQTRKLAKGVKEIGEVLGCGKTKTQALLNTGFLTDYEVGYYLGRTPIMDNQKWDALPSELKVKITTQTKKKQAFRPAFSYLCA